MLRHLLRAIDLLDRITRLDRAAKRVDRIRRIRGHTACVYDLDRLRDLARIRLAPFLDPDPDRRAHTLRNPFPITYCSIEICRELSGLAVFATANFPRTW